MKQNYTFDLIKFNNKFPLASSIVKQVVFWIISYSMLLYIIHLVALSVFNVFDKNLKVNFWPVSLFVIIVSLFLGIGLGLLDGFLKKTFFKNLPLGANILISSISYFLVLMVIISISRIIIFGISDDFILYNSDIDFMLEENWNYFNSILMVYTFFMSLVISFVNQMNKKFGPGMLLPFLFGRFRYPREEERIFMFLDLTSSTEFAEKLGHIRYSELIQASFLDINKKVKEFNAEIYQYVGDEVVISWPVQGFKKAACVEFFFAVQELLVARSEFYNAKIGVVSKFKAGLHVGLVTAVEVGDIKRDIAYHGDTLNVAARIEGLCNEYKASILASGSIIEKGKLQGIFSTTSLGFKILQGRKNPIEIFSITK
ncbi:adenylate/guanylate cyclase domain-containing protein [Zunongwangia sp. F260]|uniref:Adenylate/guanylate cyclase domain-containing protein n=1 Tax=Autumnicola lenta TaxID=3075593 RepID=A0ABU3CM19_9FLAO|nr:adenylate/guanylate cyclase domain-containing protein [Zunongwangia sp. F260]MDT0647385.1 adenylate/guanylate cyclase domain-containing protein [Zunongwangia sp. F260]